MLRESRSISPVLSGSNRSLADSGRVLDLGRIVEHRGGDRAAKIDVEPGPIALVVGAGESRQSLADAADQRAAILHLLERLGGCRRHRETERARNAEEEYPAFHGATFRETGIVERRPQVTSSRFLESALERRASPAGRPDRWCPACGHLRTIAHRGQGVDARALRGHDPKVGLAARALGRYLQEYPIRSEVVTKKKEIDPADPTLRAATRLVVGGRDSFANHGFVNPPVHHVSTVLYPSAEDFLARRARYLYGRRGTPTSEALENALRTLEGPACAGVALLPSGLAAISTALLSVLARRRPRAGHRQRLPADAQILRQRADALRHRHDLLRPDDRRRHREADPAEHPRGVRRGARLA